MLGSPVLFGSLMGLGFTCLFSMARWRSLPGRGRQASTYRRRTSVLSHRGRRRSQCQLRLRTFRHIVAHISPVPRRHSHVMSSQSKKLYACRWGLSPHTGTGCLLPVPVPVTYYRPDKVCSSWEGYAKAELVGEGVI